MKYALFAVIAGGSGILALTEGQVDKLIDHLGTLLSIVATVVSFVLLKRQTTNRKTITTQVENVQAEVAEVKTKVEAGAAAATIASEKAEATATAVAEAIKVAAVPMQVELTVHDSHGAEPEQPAE